MGFLLNSFNYIYFSANNKILIKLVISFLNYCFWNYFPILENFASVRVDPELVFSEVRYLSGQNEPDLLTQVICTVATTVL
jgi:hypothetical protein